MESELTEEEVIQRAMAASEAEERAKWIGLEEAIQHRRRHLHLLQLSSCRLLHR
jgi:hypothetical protein